MAFILAIQILFPQIAGDQGYLSTCLCRSDFAADIPRRVGTPILHLGDL